MDSPLSPVTIIGIHGSGTSMSLGRWKTMGLFVGEVKDDNHVAFFFQQIDEWLISQSEGSWTQPPAVYELVENDELRRMMTDYIGRYFVAIAARARWAHNYRRVWSHKGDSGFSS